MLFVFQPANIYFSHKNMKISLAGVVNVAQAFLAHIKQPY